MGDENTALNVATHFSQSQEREHVFTKRITKTLRLYGSVKPTKERNYLYNFALLRHLARASPFSL